MNRHWHFLMSVLGLMIAGFVLGIADDSLLITFGSIVIGSTLASLLGVAFLRAPGHTPEHHPRVDRWFDDTAP